ncbi:MAG: peptide chain release factor N(5)-glutamine methyltransferase [Magnetococcales bacterium]|nr:peptide chain release factor N(5)-glutamine methyltransferase [Magnetococcales bacterium]
MPTTWTVRTLLTWSHTWLSERGCDSPRLDAELLLAHALRIDRLRLFLDPDRPLTPDELANYRTLIKRRGEREPVAYILQNKGFWSLDLHITPGVLIPRPDTECLVETVRNHCEDRQKAWRFLDVGIGSGAILLSLLHDFPNSQGVATDISATAIACAQTNAETLKLSSRCDLRSGSLLTPLTPDETFDVIVSNPPYIDATEWRDLAPEVYRWEPQEALWGGEDGLMIYRELIPQTRPHLKPGGLLAVEIGWKQGERVSRLFEEAGFKEVTVLKDYGQRDRVVRGMVPGSDV